MTATVATYVKGLLYCLAALPLATGRRENYRIDEVRLSAVQDDRAHLQMKPVGRLLHSGELSEFELSSERDEDHSSSLLQQSENVEHLIESSAVQSSVAELESSKARQMVTEALHRAADSVKSAYVSVAVGSCHLNDEGQRTGCRSGCQCAWLDQCYPKYVYAAPSRQDTTEVSAPQELPRIDVGVCDAAVGVLIFVSCMLFTGLFGCVVGMRIVLQWRERLAELRLRSQQALAYKAQLEEEAEAEAILAAEAEAEAAAEAAAKKELQEPHKQQELQEQPPMHEQEAKTEADAQSAEQLDATAADDEPVQTSSVLPSSPPAA